MLMVDEVPKRRRKILDMAAMCKALYAFFADSKDEGRWGGAGQTHILLFKRDRKTQLVSSTKGSCDGYKRLRFSAVISDLERQ